MKIRKYYKSAQDENENLIGIEDFFLDDREGTHLGCLIIGGEWNGKYYPSTGGEEENFQEFVENTLQAIEGGAFPYETKDMWKGWIIEDPTDEEIFEVII